MPRHLLGAAAALAAALALAAPAGAATFGSPGLGDPFFPLAGNGGYDVGHYALALDYDRAGNRLAGTTTITATATQALDRFDLDLRGFDDLPRSTSTARPRPSPVTARSCRSRRASRLVAGKAFTVRVDYAGTPASVVDPDGSHRGLDPDRRRRDRRQRAAGHAGLVPGQRQPARQGDLRLLDHRARGDHGARATACCGPRRPAAARPRGSGARARRWRRYLATATNGRFNLYHPDRSERPADLQRHRREGDALRAAGEQGAVAPLQARRDRVVLQRPLRRRTRSRRPAGSSTRSATSATRSRRRPSRSTRTCPTRSRSSTSSRTCGSATP